MAVISSFAYGSSDFLGGLAAKHAPVLRVVAIAALAGLAGVLCALPLIGAHFSAQAVAWGMANGLASVAASVLLYRCLALGPMNVLSPLAAVISAVLPLLVALAQGERLEGLAAMGIALAFVAVVLISARPRQPARRPLPVALLCAVGAGGAVATQAITLDHAPPDSALAPVVVSVALNAMLTVTAEFVARIRSGPRPGMRTAAAMSGLVAALAHVAFLLAVRQGPLSVVAVISALYPAVTVVLARTVLHERIARVHQAGFAVAVAAVSLLAWSRLGQ
ncbi:EamA family transporter [Streptomyces sp. NPDC058335]|uniref:EamA family transporter n=1 Tax=Streptomyces sp. NPDC058335 TaxID=3346451 RepID=UPI00365394FE